MISEEILSGAVIPCANDANQELRFLRAYSRLEGRSRAVEKMHPTFDSKLDSIVDHRQVSFGHSCAEHLEDLNQSGSI